MRHVIGLQCVICGKRHPPAEVDYVCPDHGNEGILDVCYDYDFIRRQITREDLSQNPDVTIWRYRPLLPVAPEAPVPPLTVGGTPLYRAERLGLELGLTHLWIKDEGRLPTASLKDRASTIAVVKARERGASIVATASSGNAAAALSGLCASVGLDNVIFVPASAPPAKIVQLLVYGSTVMLVEGTYDDAFDLCMEATRTYGWYNRNTGYNPYMSEGKKTAVFEICEQLGWVAPDRIFVSVGDGCIIGGLHKGLKDLQALGWIDRMPGLMGVQAEGSSYLAQAWETGEDVLRKPPVSPRTVADSISAGLPRDRIKAMAAVRQTGGAFVTVSDREILAAVVRLGRGCGVFAEPAGAAALAGLIKAIDQGRVGSGERVVVVSTGNGLKDVAGAMQAVDSHGTRACRIRPDMADLERALQIARKAN